MAANRSRRAFLASLGAASLAGCTSNAPVTEADTTGTSTPRAAPEPPARIDAEWPMPAHDAGLSNATRESAGPTAPLAALWQVTADTTLSQPVLADETLYVGGADGTVLALDARTGEERWRQSVGVGANAPWAVGEDLYVPTAEAIVALSATRGDEQWRVDIPDRAGILVAAHGVYWISEGVVAGLGREDGSERWRTPLQDPWEPHLFAGEASLFVSTGTNGRIPWTVAPETGNVAGNEPEPGHDFPAERFYLDGTVYAVDPFFGIVAGDGWNQGVKALGAGELEYGLSGGLAHVYYIANGGEEPGLYALSRTDGTVEWSAHLNPETVSRPVVAGESILVHTGEKLRCFDPIDGTERWARQSDGIGERVIVADDLVYTTQDDAVRAFRSL